VPASAAAARAVLHDELLQTLLNDDSPFALCQGRPERLRQLMADSLNTILAGIPEGTMKADESGLKWIAHFCLAENIAFKRPLTLTDSDKPRERLMYAMLLCYCAKHMNPRSKNRFTADGRVITDAKPPSALAPCYAWRRFLKDSGCELVDMKTVVPHLKGLNAKFRAKWGDNSLVPVRQQPFEREQLIKIVTDLDAIAAAARITGDRIKAMAVDALSLAITWSLATGSRAEEVSGETDMLPLSAFSWVVDGIAQPDTLETHKITALLEGALLRAHANASKCDRDNMTWGDRDMWFRVHHDNPLNFAARFRQWMVRYWHLFEQRGSTPAFSPDGIHPWQRGTLQRRFNEQAIASLGELIGKAKRWHALRVTAATALNSARQADGVIQCVLRWKTLEAMRLYAKMDRQQYADAVDLITSTNIVVTKAASNPPTGPEDLQSELHDIQQWLEHDASDEERSMPVRSSKARTRIPPQPEESEAPAPSPPSARQVVVLGSSVELKAVDTTNMTGCMVEVPNALWPKEEGDTWEESGFTTCMVVGRCASNYAYDGARAAPSHIIDYEGELFPVKTTSLRDFIDKQKRRQGKQRK